MSIVVSYIVQGEWLALIFHTLALIHVWTSLNQAKSQVTVDKMNKSSLVIREGCVCPDHTLILECIIAVPHGARGSIVWRGTAFDCPYSNDEINLLHTNKFNESNTVPESCNNGSIVAQNLRIDADHDEDIYTSQLNVTINSWTTTMILGKTIICQYDNNINSTQGVLLSTLVTTQFNSSEVNYLVKTTNNGRTIISFTWNPFNVSTCPAIPYILASNCGHCPTTTNHTTVNCTDVPSDTTYCSFALIPTICGRISPNLSVVLDVKLKDSNKGQSDLIAACIFLTLIIIALLILIGIALFFRFKDYFKRMFRFQFDIPIGRKSVRLCSNREIGIYSCVDKTSETNGSVLKIFDNENEEKGIYGIDDDRDQNKPQYYNTGCQAKGNSQAVNLQIASKTSDADPPVNLENLQIKFGEEIKTQWYIFGEAIGIPKDYLDTLLGGNEMQCLKNVLDHWLRHHPGQPMWEEVFKAQRKIKLLNQFDLKDKAAEHDVDVPPPKPPRRRSSVNRSHSLSIAPIKTSSDQQENFYDTLK